MKKYYLISTAKEVLQKKSYAFSFPILTVFLFIILFSLPIIIAPTITFSYQISLFTFVNYLLLFMVSVLLSLSILFNIYSYKKTKKLQSGKAALSGSSGLLAAIFGTATCPSCLAVLFGFLGTGTLVFLVKYNVYISLLASLFILSSLFLTSKKIQELCINCQDKK